MKWTRLSAPSLRVVMAVLLFALVVGLWYVSKNVLYTGEPKEQSSRLMVDQSQSGLSWKRAREIVEKSHHVNRLGDIPQGVSEDEYYMVFRMETARLNSLADGEKYPWRGDVGMYYGNSNYDRSPIDDELIRNVRAGHHFLELHGVLLSDGKTIATENYLQLNIDANSTCVMMMRDFDGGPDSRIEFKCVDADKPGYPLKRGLVGTAQVYGTRINSQIKVSKLVITTYGALYPGAQFDNLQ